MIFQSIHRVAATERSEVDGRASCQLGQSASYSPAATYPKFYLYLIFDFSPYRRFQTKKTNPGLHFPHVGAILDMLRL
jgi:hypothetical protein